MASSLLEQISTRLEDLQQEGLFKAEHVLSSPQHASVKTEEGRELLNFCANNYLGLSNHPELVRAASSALENYGFGMSSVRFICGTLGRLSPSRRAERVYLWAAGSQDMSCGHKTYHVATRHISRVVVSCLLSSGKEQAITRALDVRWSQKGVRWIRIFSAFF